jgi:hypothetical protein
MYNLQADSSFGVYSVSSLGDYVSDEFELETLSENEFLEELKGLEDNRIIGAIVSQETYDKIKEIHGITAK